MNAKFTAAKKFVTTHRHSLAIAVVGSAMIVAGTIEQKRESDRLLDEVKEANITN